MAHSTRPIVAIFTPANWRFVNSDWIGVVAGEPAKSVKAAARNGRFYRTDSRGETLRASPADLRQRSRSTVRHTLYRRYFASADTPFSAGAFRLDHGLGQSGPTSPLAIMAADFPTHTNCGYCAPRQHGVGTKVARRPSFFFCLSKAFPWLCRSCVRPPGQFSKAAATPRAPRLSALSMVVSHKCNKMLASDAIGRARAGIRGMVISASRTISG